MNDMTKWDFRGATVRTVTVNGDPWWIAKDVCDVLGIGNVSQALSYLDDDEKGITTNDTLGGAQKMSVINEAGLYSLILRSRKPEAKDFKRWVTHEVLPSIRKTGQYSVRQKDLPVEYLRQIRLAVKDGILDVHEGRVALGLCEEPAGGKVPQDIAEQVYAVAAKSIERKRRENNDKRNNPELFD